MKPQDIIKRKPYLAWYVKNPSKLSDESVLEHVLNYGNWEDVQTYIHHVGLSKTANISFHNRKPVLLEVIGISSIRQWSESTLPSECLW